MVAAVVVLSSYGDFRRIVQVALGNATDGGRHGCRKQCDLAILWGLLQHPLHIVDKAHAQHFIGLVEHQGFEIVELDVAAAHVIHDPSRGADDDVDAALQGANLGAVVLSTVYRQHVETFGL